MANLFGFNIKTKEEREQEYQEYVQKIFPYGEPQKCAVQALLKELLPKEDQTALMMYYIQLRENLAANPALTIAEADARVTQRVIWPRTPEGKPIVFALLEVDNRIGPELSYPSCEEIREAAKIL